MFAIVLDMIVEGRLAQGSKTVRLAKAEKLFFTTPKNVKEQETL
jgi:hypothetical protein